MKSQNNFTKSNRISWNPENSKYFMKPNRVLLKETEFHKISWNQQDLTQFLKIQHNFDKTSRIYWNPEISKDSMKSNRILLKVTEFYKISLNLLQCSLQILLQISLWISFMDFTADFIMDFTGYFMLNPPNFIINFMTNFIRSTRISLKSMGFLEIHSISLKSTRFHYGFHCQISKWNPQWNL